MYFLNHPNGPTMLPTELRSQMKLASHDTIKPFHYCTKAIETCNYRLIDIFRATIAAKITDIATYRATATVKQL